MSKELEALKQVKNFLGYNYCSVDLPNELKLIEQALQRLEAIENSNPSEVLENLGVLETYFYNKWKSNYFLEDKPKELNIINTIKQTLLKAQEQEKVLKVIFEKKVSIFQLSCCKNVYEYNDLKFKDNEKLTQEEFDLLKRYFDVWTN